MSKKIVSIIIFPGSNCDRDLAVAIEKHLNVKIKYVWHDNSEINDYGSLAKKVFRIENEFEKKLIKVVQNLVFSF